MAELKRTYEANTGFINFLCSPKYHFLPRNFGWWKLVQKLGGGSAAGAMLMSSDDYRLQDKNGVNLIPMEDEHTAGDSVGTNGTELMSSDGYIFKDKNGLNFVTKEE